MVPGLYPACSPAFGRDDRWTGAPSLPNEQSVCQHFWMPSPRVALRKLRLLHFRRVLLTQPALLDLLLFEQSLGDGSWLSLVNADLQWMASLTSIPASALQFPEGFAEWLLHEPAAFRLAVKKAVSALNAPTYEPKWHPVPSGSVAATPGFRCNDCGVSFHTYQQLSAHDFAVHRRECPARRLTRGTKCPTCLMQCWTRARLIRHLQHDAKCCLPCIIDHGLDPEEVDLPGTDLQHLPNVRLQGPRLPLWLSVSDFAQEVIECPEACAMWGRRWLSPAMARWVEAAELLHGLEPN